jgi:hypothetical protein
MREPSGLGYRNRDASNATTCLELRELSEIKEYVWTEGVCERAEYENWGIVEI